MHIQILTLSEAALRENYDTTRKASVFFLLLKVRCVINIVLTRHRGCKHAFVPKKRTEGFVNS